MTQKTGPIVKLNVGGKVFDTSTETLTRDENSMLARMFSGTRGIGASKDGIGASKDENDRFFIDRDGDHFRHILNWLRDESEPPQDVDPKPLLREARFYQLTTFEKYLEARIGQDLDLKNKESLQSK